MKIKNQEMPLGSDFAAVKKQSGFTLLELLVVLAIIGLLAGVIMLALNSAREKARNAKRAGDIRQMITALEQYYVQHSEYPTGTASVTSAGTSGALLSDPGSFNGSVEPFIPNYIPIIPNAPIPQDGGCGSGSGPGNNNYWYEAADDGTKYTMTFCLGSDTGDWLAGIKVATPDGVQ